METKNSLWPGWKTGQRIGGGGFGSVYEIYREQYGFREKAAVKVITIPQNEGEIDLLRIEGLDDESITTKFKEKIDDIANEYRLMIGLRGCINVVHCDDILTVQFEEGLGWKIHLKMELLTPLLKVMDRLKSEKQILKFAMDMCNALSFCHKKHILHRDIKPQNILVDEDGNFKLGDFGISRTIFSTVTEGTVGIGSYNYMAPEIKNGNRPYGVTADVYSLGMVLYWMLNEYRGPFLPKHPVDCTVTMVEEALRRRFAGERLPAPSCGRPELVKIVLKACEYDPNKRYSSAQEMYADLKRLYEKLDDDATVIVADQLPEPILDEDSINPDDEPTIWSNPDKKPDEFKKDPKPSVNPVLYVGIAVLLLLVASLSGALISFVIGKDNQDEMTGSTYSMDTQFQEKEILPEAQENRGAYDTKSSDEFADEETVALTEDTDVQINSVHITPGSVLTFGEYEQDGNISNGAEPIEWIVLKQEGKEALIISLYGLDTLPYEGTKEFVDWENCSLRTWLENTFYEDVFTQSEKQCIVKKTVIQHANKGYPYSKQGNNTSDHVFLLSTGEYIDYLYNNEAVEAQFREGIPSAYALQKNIDTYDYYKGPRCWWWLRTSSANNDKACFVAAMGPSEVYVGYPISKSGGLVRPAMWITLP